jgi:hypothetical protein
MFSNRVKITTCNAIKGKVALISNNPPELSKAPASTRNKFEIFIILYSKFKISGNYK